MNNFRVILFCTLFALCLQLRAQDKYMEIELNSVVVKQIKNYKKFDFYDSANNYYAGKIYILNDSQFCFLNFFNEKSSRDFNINEINSFYYQLKKRRAIPALAVVGICLIPGGIYFLIIREILRKKREPVINSKGTVEDGYKLKGEFKVKIKTIT